MSTELEQKDRVSLRVNGKEVSAEVPARMLLSDLLRDELGLTGTHVGCESGACGACTVMLDGMAVRSCLCLAASAAGSEVVTVEGVGSRDELHPIQQALWEEHGLQCGYCTPGFVMSLYAILAEEGSLPTDDAEIREALSGNLCRCTGYQHIVKAVKRADELLAADKAGDAA